MVLILPERTFGSQLSDGYSLFPVSLVCYFEQLVCAIPLFLFRYSVCSVGFLAHRMLYFRLRFPLSDGLLII